MVEPIELLYNGSNMNAGESANNKNSNKQYNSDAIGKQTVNR